MKWLRHYRCAYCHGRGLDELPRAVIRVFSGAGMGAGMSGGFPACERHVGDALEAAFATLNKPNPPNDWEVSAYRVTADIDDYPQMTRIWTAQATPE